MPNITCPHCHFQRLPSDKGPSWQCPNCGKAYNQNRGIRRTGSGQSVARSRPHAIVDNAPFLLWQSRLNYCILAAVCIGILSFYYKGQFPSASEISPPLLQEPRQTNTSKSLFSFTHSDHTYNVQPAAQYELWGLVVSHNDTSNLVDIYHEESSLDTRDLCVLWGDNLRTNNFRHATFTSGSWTCHIELPKGIFINRYQVSNNHLITSAEEVRKKIAQINIGDQVHIKGWLVNYKQDQGKNFWRKTSLSRRDLGNDAGEVLFVKQIDVLKPGNSHWYLAWEYSLIACLALVILKILVLVFEVSPHRYQ